MKEIKRAFRRSEKKPIMRKGNRMKEKLAVIITLIVIAGACYGVFTYLEKYALCEDVKKVEEKTDKQIQMIEKKTEGVQKQMDYKFKAIDLKTTEDRIYDMEKRYSKAPKDSVKQADLDKLRREREQILRDMEDIKKK